MYLIIGLIELTIDGGRGKGGSIMSYTWEKFHQAIHSLAGSGSQRERLVNAYVFNITHVKVEEVPKEIQEEFQKFTKDMTCIPAKGSEGSVQATVNKMTEIEVIQMIERIISMHDTITRHEEPF